MDMKKTIWILLALMCLSRPAWALDPDGRTDMGAWGRAGYVMSRGLLNAFTIPMEIPSTFIREHRMHPKAWPLTFIPKFLFNFGIVRTPSAINDIGFYPWYVAFTDDLSPWTEAFDLPPYPWQVD
jgi:hypothetical protein